MVAAGIGAVLVTAAPAGAASAVTGSSAAIGSSAATGPTRQVPLPAGGGWHSYTRTVPDKAAVSVVQWKKNSSGGCEITQTGTARPGAVATETHELAFNLSTCQSQMATYPLTSTELAAAEQKDAAASSAGVTAPTAPASAGASLSSAGVTAASLHRAAYSQTWYEDPPGLDVTKVRNDTDWYSNGSCVTSASGSYAYNWLSASGWSKQSSNWRNTSRCAQSESSSYAKFRNGVFCATIDTYNTYDRNNIWGKPNGSYTWSYHATKSGGCTALLSIHHRDAYK
jgi:hypothetical protein